MIKISHLKGEKGKGVSKKENWFELSNNSHLNTAIYDFESFFCSCGSRIFEKGGRGNVKVTLGLLRLNINV